MKTETIFCNLTIGVKGFSPILDSRLEFQYHLDQHLISLTYDGTPTGFRETWGQIYDDLEQKFFFFNPGLAVFAIKQEGKQTMIHGIPLQLTRFQVIKRWEE